jgi:hypothetical protein
MHLLAVALSSLGCDDTYFDLKIRVIKSGFIEVYNFLGESELLEYIFKAFSVEIIVSFFKNLHHYASTLHLDHAITHNVIRIHGQQ